MSRRPRWLARTGVTLAARALPPGPVRDRYRREFVAELHAMSQWQSTKYVLEVLITAPRLRKAILSGAAEAGTLRSRPGVPLTCRLNLHHQWHICSTEDGGLFKECSRCHRAGVQGLFKIWHYPGDDARRSFNA